jgi:ATP dependent DNA ligase-like protein
MAFGFKNPRRIREPICEPLWWGVRVLVHVDEFGVRIRDVDGTEIDGWPDLREAIRWSASSAQELVFDAYLVPAFGDTVGVEGFSDVDLPSSRSVVRTFFFGSLGSNKRDDRAKDAQARIVDVNPDADAAIVAIDLLWLDGESLLDLPLAERKRLLDAVLVEKDLVRRTVHVRPPVETWYRQWRAFGFREFAVKDANSRYVPGGESDLWTTASIPKR